MHIRKSLPCGRPLLKRTYGYSEVATRGAVALRASHYPLGYPVPCDVRPWYLGPFSRNFVVHSRRCHDQADHVKK
jgi:hypothetical protein